jgi:dihydroorotase
MKILLQQATVSDPSSPFNGHVADILIDDGSIISIAKNIDASDARIVNMKGKYVSPGWMDSFAHFCDPGDEYKETIETGIKSAAAGGFTSVAVIPNTNPVVQTKSQVEYVISRSRNQIVNVLPMGAVSKSCEGKDLAEMYDMRSAGAIAFTDGLNAIQSAGILLKALQYVKAFNGLVLQIPDDTSINPHGLMNEGIISTTLGLPGKPAMAEEIMVARDIKLARYTESRLHFAGVSSAKSLEYIQRAKEGGIQISCSVTPYHLYFSDEDIKGYDTHLKVNPPLRTPKDRNALRKALQEGIIDTVSSFHIPQDWDHKICEFEYARPGMIGLETAFAATWSVMNKLWSVDDWVNTIAIRSRNIFGLAIPSIKEGSKAELTLFNPNHSFVFTQEMICSRSKNSAFIGKELKGAVLGVINNKQLFLNP